jgi:hypothetical protein
VTAVIERPQPDVTAITVDVEWAHPRIVAEVTARLDERGLRATFFCTHAGVDVPGHERALHPNFRRCGNSLLDSPGGVEAARGADRDFYRFVVETTHAFCPEAVGVRAHSLFFDTDVLAEYAARGLRYDSSYFLPLAAGLAPVRKHRRVLELPLFYMDHWDMVEAGTNFELARVTPPGGGLRIFAFHPNLVYLNASEPAHYEASRACYHDVDALRKLVRPGRGVGTLFLELLDHLANGGGAVATMAEIEERWRAGESRATESVACG